MFKQLIKLLEEIYEINWNGDTPTEAYLKLKGNKQEVINKANELRLIDFGGKPNGQAEYFQLTKEGYELLQQHTNFLLNKEMLGHTKTMKKLSWAMFIFTLINLILIGVQIYLTLK